MRTYFADVALADGRSLLVEYSYAHGGSDYFAGGCWNPGDPDECEVVKAYAKVPLLLRWLWRLLFKTDDWEVRLSDADHDLVVEKLYEKHEPDEPDYDVERD